jgi:hypothetical protein
MATRPSIRIPKTVSSPADPSAPSILRTLPPELRNRIYDVLFHCKKPLVLYDAVAHRARLFEVMTWRDVDSGQLGDVEPETEDEKIRYNLAQSMNLLQTCRQVYYEAAGVLYGSNSFHFSRLLDADDHKHHKLHEYAPKLLSSMGSHYSLLTKVSIDVPSFCTPHHSCSSEELQFDLLPFLRLIWANPDSSCKMIFVNSDSEYNNMLRILNLSASVTHVSAKLLNNLLLTLGHDDALNIKRYARFHRLMPAVVVYPALDGLPRAWVAYRLSDTVTDMDRICTYFDVHENGRFVKWTPQAPDRASGSLLQLPWKIQDTINRYASTPIADVVWDFNARTALGLNMNTLHLSRDTRKDALDLWQGSWHKYLFTPGLSRNLQNTGVDHFDALRAWSQVELFDDLIIGTNRMWETQSEITLDLTSMGQASLKASSVNVKVLLEVLGRLPDWAPITLIRKSPDESDKDCRETVCITLGSIQRAVFLLLSEILQNMPHKALSPIPELWIDGHGKLQCAQYPATSTALRQIIDYRHSDLSEDEVQNLGYVMIRKLMAMVRADRLNDVPTFGVLPDSVFFESPEQPYMGKTGNLIEMWMNLRWCFWNNWDLVDL